MAPAAQLAHPWSASLNLADLAQALRRVWESTGGTVVLFVSERSMRLCVAEITSTKALGFERGVGYRERLARAAYCIKMPCVKTLEQFD